ncbi:MAG: hypothetical protein MZW92_65240 [Comamonadaceae bacterium]|nr:hypothetical protein [Comamonadaceae bacterium]
MPLLGDMPLARRAVPQRDRTQAAHQPDGLPAPDRRCATPTAAARLLGSTATTQIRARQQAAQPTPSAVLQIDEAPVLPPLPNAAPQPVDPAKPPLVEPVAPAPQRRRAGGRRAVAAARRPLRSGGPAAGTRCAAAAGPTARSRTEPQPMATPTPAALRLRARPTRCCSRTTARSSCCGPARRTPPAALAEVTRLFDVRRVRARGRRRR